MDFALRRQHAGLTIIGAILVCGAAPAAQPMAVEPAYRVQVPYTCAFPSGPVTAEVTMRVTLPPRAEPGKSIQPREVAVSASVPRRGVDDLARLGAVSVSGAMTLAVTARQNGPATDARWPALAVPAMPVPRSGPLVLNGGGEVPAVRVLGPGDITFTAGALTLNLVLKNAQGGPTKPPTLPVRCMAGREVRLGSVLVPGRSPSPKPTDEGDVRPKANGDPPPECQVIDPAAVSSMCAYLGGYSTTRKVKAANRLDPAILNLAVLETSPCDQTFLCIKVKGKFNDENGQPNLPLSRFTYLSYGFFPVRSTLRLTQVGVLDIEVRLDIDGVPPDRSTIVARGEQMLHVIDTFINGKRLDLGDRCRSSRPLQITLRGDASTYSIAEGGTLDGVLTIPPFSECGVSEDLTPLLDGVISGAGNHLKVTQGAPCTLGTNAGCPPERREPER